MRYFLVIFFSVVPILIAQAVAEDCPQWGEKHSRNMVSNEKGLPDSFDPGRRDPKTRLVKPESTTNVRWTAPLGSVVYGTPIIAEGKVLIGTTESQRKDSRAEFDGDRGVLVCLDEKSGAFLWELVVPKMFDIKFSDWHRVGISSSPSVENGKAYFISNRCEVVCLDLQGMKNGNDGDFKDEAKHCVEEGIAPVALDEQDADILWLNDLVESQGVMPHNASNCSVLIDGDFLYVCTGNGTDWTHRHVMNPEAPSLIVLDKNTGKILARDDFGLGPNIVHGQWSSPSLGVVNGKKLVFQGTGSGFLFAVEAITADDLRKAEGTNTSIKLRNIWKFNGHPLAQKQEIVPLEHFHDTKSYEVVANPVFHKDRVYVAFTQELYHNIPNGQLLCLDATKTGDTTRNGGLIWSYEGISSSGSTVAIFEGLLYIADGKGKLHCLDADTGEKYWDHDIGDPVWGSPLLADGKIYIGTGRRILWVFAHGKEKKLLSRVITPGEILASVTAANGTLYVPVFGTLYALAQRSD